MSVRITAKVFTFLQISLNLFYENFIKHQNKKGTNTNIPKYALQYKHSKLHIIILKNNNNFIIVISYNNYKLMF